MLSRALGKVVGQFSRQINKALLALGMELVHCSCLLCDSAPDRGPFSASVLCRGWQNKLNMRLSAIAVAVDARCWVSGPGKIPKSTTVVSSSGVSARTD